MSRRAKPRDARWLLRASAAKPLNLREVATVRRLTFKVAERLIDRMRYHGLLSRFKKGGKMWYEPGTAGKRALARRGR